MTHHRLAVGVALALTLGGCSTTTTALRETFTGTVATADALEVTPSLRGHASPTTGGTPALRVHLVRLADQRTSAGTDGRHLGKIRSTVMDMHASTLQLTAPAADVLSRVLKNQLQLDGVQVQDHAAGADFELRGEIARLRLDVAGSDEFDLNVQLTVRELSTGKITWSGSIEETGERFAGVAGNTRASIVRWLNQGVERWSDKVGATLLARNAWTKSAAPPAVAVAPTTPAAPVPAAATPVTAPIATPTATPLTGGLQGPPKGYGYFSVITMPTRVKVYSDDIYYGLTPLRVMVPTGVMSFDFRFDGYKPVTQKVLIRKDETTELQLQLQKQ